MRPDLTFSEASRSRQRREAFHAFSLGPAERRAPRIYRDDEILPHFGKRDGPELPVIRCAIGYTIGLDDYERIDRSRIVGRESCLSSSHRWGSANSRDRIVLRGTPRLPRSEQGAVRLVASSLPCVLTIDSAACHGRQSRVGAVE